MKSLRKASMRMNELANKYRELETDFLTVKAVRYDEVRIENASHKAAAQVYIERKDELVQAIQKAQNALKTAQNAVLKDITELLPVASRKLAADFLLNGYRGEELAARNNMSWKECSTEISKILQAIN